jgi:D-serine deaminase-like pyridoxal phosphate-dependent protein
MEDLTAAQEKASAAGECTIRLMVDHAAQVAALAEAHARLNRATPWSVFVKVDGGGKRAGAPPRSEQMRDLVLKLRACKEVEVYGFYSREYGARGEATSGGAHPSLLLSRQHQSPPWFLR